MSIRWRLVTLAAVVFAIMPMFVDARFDSPTAIAQGATVLMSGPSVDAAPPGPQPAPTACENTCRAEFDRRITVASVRLTNRDYSPLTNCPSPWSDKSGVPVACSAAYYTCVDQCRDGNCINRCMVSLQPCCHANDVENRKHDLGLCLAACPKPNSPAELAQPSSPPAKPMDRKAQFLILLKNTWAMMDALGPAVEGMDIQRLNNVRRELALAQVVADLATSGRDFSLVVGGGGRLWFVRADGKRELFEQEPSPEELMSKSGLSAEQANHALFIMHRYQRGGAFAPATYLCFSNLSYMEASSEHSSIRGTINGGGDFI